MDWTVDQGGYFENTRDACGCGNPMAVYVEGTKQSFDKGVAMHAPAELGVNLEGKKYGFHRRGPGGNRRDD